MLTVGTIQAIAKMKDEVTPQLPILEKAVRATTRRVNSAKQAFANLERSLRKSGERAKATGERLSKMGRRGVAASATITAGIVATVTAFGKFEKGMNRVRALTGATDKQFAALRDQAKHLGITTQFSAHQAADGMSFLAQAGFEVEDIMTAMPGMLNLAAAAQIDLAQSADIASNVLSAFRLETAEIDRVVDVMAKTFSSANTDMVQLGEAFKYVAPIATGAGQSLEDVAAMIGTLGNAGLQASVAGTGLRAMIVQLAKPTEEAEAVLRRAGVTVTDVDGKMRPLTDIVLALSEASLTTSDMMALFGTRAGAAGEVLAAATESTEDLREAIANAGGTAEHIASVQLEGIAGTFTMFMSAVSGLAIEIGEQFIPVLTWLLNTLSSISRFVADKIIPVFARMPRITKVVAVAVVLLAAAFAPLTLAAGTAMKVIGFMKITLARLIPQMLATRLGAVAMWGAITGGVLIAISLFWAFRKRIGDVLSWIIEKLTSLVSKFVGFLGKITQHIPFVGDKLQGLAESMQGMTESWGASAAGWVDGWGETAEEVESIADQMSEAVESVWTDAKNAGETAYHTVLEQAIIAGKGTEEAALQAAQAQKEAIEDYMLAERDKAVEAARLSASLAAVKAGNETGAAEAAEAAANNVVEHWDTAYRVLLEADEKAASKRQRVLAAQAEAMKRELFEKLLDQTVPKVESAWNAAKKAGVEAYNGMLNAALDAGEGTEEAARLAAQAQTDAVEEVLNAERDKLARTAAFEAALKAIKTGNAGEAVRLAQAASNEVKHAWGLSMEAVGQAHKVSAQVAGKAAEDTADANEEAAKRTAEATLKLHNATTDSVLAAIDKAKDAGLDAYEKTLQAAVHTGLGQEEAAIFAARAQELATAKALEAERRKYIRVQAFEAALQAFKEGRAEEAVKDAETAAANVAGAWEASLKFIEGAHEAVAEAGVQAAEEVQEANEEASEAAKESAKRAKAVLQDVYERVRERFAELADSVVQAFRDMGGPVGETMSTFARSVIDQLSTIGRSAGESLLGSFSKVFEAANIAFPGVASLVTGIVGQLFDGVMSIFRGADEAAQRALEAARKEAERVKRVMDDVVDALGTGFKRAAEEGKTAFEEAFDSLYTGGVLTLEDLVKLDSADAKSFLDAYAAGIEAQQAAIQRIMEEEKTRFLLAVGYEAELKRIKGESTQTAYEAMKEAEEAWLNTTNAMRQLTIETEADVEAITEAFVKRQQEIFDGLVNNAIPKVQQAFTSAAKAGTTAFGEAYDAAIEAGKGQQEAARLAAEAQIAASELVLAQKKFEFQRTAAFNAAMSAIQSGNADKAIEAARRAAQMTGEAWDVALKAVVEAEKATDAAMQEGETESAERQERAQERTKKTAETSADAADSIGDDFAATGKHVEETMNTVAAAVKTMLQELEVAAAAASQTIVAELEKIPDTITVDIVYNKQNGLRETTSTATQTGNALNTVVERLATTPSLPSDDREVVLNLDGHELGRVMLNRIRGVAQQRGY